jgi:hypothetical protein
MRAEAGQVNSRLCHHAEDDCPVRAKSMTELCAQKTIVASQSQIELGGISGVLPEKGRMLPTKQMFGHRLNVRLSERGVSCRSAVPGCAQQLRPIQRASALGFAGSPRDADFFYGLQARVGEVC